MILASLRITSEELEHRTGWELNDRGACKGEVCIPLSPETHRDGLVDVALLADQLQMPIVHDEKHGIWSLGPPSGGRALASAAAPPLVLPDLQGEPFDLRSLRGQKVLLVAWASW
jgi:hypothetical protein